MVPARPPEPTPPPAQTDLRPAERARRRRRLAHQLAHAESVRAWADVRIRELMAELGDEVAS
jgi:hypothetical protein